MKLNEKFLVHSTGRETIMAPSGKAGFSGVVRGGKSFGVMLEILKNDVTEEDAIQIGLEKYCRILGNGSGIAGTYLPSIAEEARAVLASADVITAKGQGNFETMLGCGLNVYYVFLCKCEWFERRFGMKHLEGVFVNERDHRFTVPGSFL